jgi:Flp pilus assembly protein TadG
MSRLPAQGLLRHWAKATGGRARRVGQNDRGAAIVEFALLVPILVIPVMGIAEFGRAYYTQMTLLGQRGKASGRWCCRKTRPQPRR